MSIEFISNAGLSLLQTAQYKAQINSTNMANARTNGYTAKSVVQTSTISNGLTTGVNTSKLSGSIDMQLQKRLREILSDAGFKGTLAKNFKELTSFFGKLNDSKNTLSAKISTFESSLIVLKNNPNKQENIQKVVQNLESALEKIRTISKNIQGQRNQISQKIEETTIKVNLILKDIHILNDEIAALSSHNQATADLEDKRREALKNLSSLVNVTVFINKDNKAIVSTAGGKLLVSSQAKNLDHNAPASISRTAKYPGGIPGILVDGQDITKEITGGKLGALIQLRDQDLTKKHEELDEFASQLKDRLNKTASHGIPHPLQESIKGAIKLFDSTPLKLTGNSQIVITDKDGKVKKIHTVNLGSTTTVGSFIRKLNSFGDINASLDAEGKLTIQPKSSTDRVILNPSDSKTTTTPQKNISQILGVNLLITGVNANDMQINPSIRKDPMTLPRGGGILKSGLAIGKTAITSGDSSTIADLLTTLKSSSFNAAGDMTKGTMSFADYSGNILSKLALKSSGAQTDAAVSQKVAKGIAQDIANKSGVNINEEIAKLAANQKAFQVAGHIIKATQNMFDTLLRMSR